MVDYQTPASWLNIKHIACGLAGTFPLKWDRALYYYRMAAWCLYIQRNKGHISEICVVLNTVLIGPHLDLFCPAVIHYSAMIWPAFPNFSPENSSWCSVGVMVGLQLCKSLFRSVCFFLGGDVFPNNKDDWPWGESQGMLLAWLKPWSLHPRWFDWR